MKSTEYERQCLICLNPTGYMNEVDVTVGIIKSDEPPICEDCYLSDNEEIIKQIDEINKNYELAKENPFLLLGF